MRAAPPALHRPQAGAAAAAAVREPLSHAAASLEYRGVLAGCACEVDLELESLEAAEQMDTTSYADLQRSSERLKICGMLWCLGECVFLGSAHHMAPGVLAWVRDYLHLPLDAAQGDLGWADVVTLVVQGQFADAVALLEEGRLGLGADVAALVRVLQSYPDDVTDVSAVRAWQSGAVAASRTFPLSAPATGAQFASPVAVPCLLLLLSGSSAVFGRPEFEQWNTWYHRLFAHLMFASPATPLRTPALKQLLTDCLAVCHVDATQSLYQAMTSSCSGLPFDLVAFVFKNGHLSLAAHLAHVLTKAGVLHMPGGDDVTGEALLPEWGVPLSDHLLLEYAHTIGAVPTLWQVAVSYSSAVTSPVGMQLTAEILAHVNPTDDVTAVKLCEAAQAAQLKGVYEGVCKLRARACLSSGQFGPALHWFGRARDDVGLAAASQGLLAAVCGPARARTRTGNSHCAEAEDPVVLLDASLSALDLPLLSRMSPWVQFLACYRAFIVSVRAASALLDTPCSTLDERAVDAQLNSHLTAAATAVHAAVVGGSAPAKYWPGLIEAAAAAGLWAHQPAVFTRSQAQDLLAAFESECQCAAPDLPEPGISVDRTTVPQFSEFSADKAACYRGWLLACYSSTICEEFAPSS